MRFALKDSVLYDWMHINGACEYGAFGFALKEKRNQCLCLKAMARILSSTNIPLAALYMRMVPAENMMMGGIMIIPSCDREQIQVCIGGAQRISPLQNCVRWPMAIAFNGLARFVR